MLIRIHKQSKDFLDGKQHDPMLNPERRQFLKEGFAGVGSLLIMPGMLSLLRANPARAEVLACNQRPLGTTFTQVSLSGGNGTSSMVYAWDAAGAPLLGNSRSLGTFANSGQDTTSIAGLTLSQSDMFSTFLRGGGGGTLTVNGTNIPRLFDAAMTTTILSRLSGGAVACPNDDDTDSNPLNVMKFFGNRCGLRKGVIADVAGNPARELSIDGLRNNFSTLQLGGNLANVGAAATLQSNTLNDSRQGESLKAAVDKLTKEQSGKLGGKVGSADFVKNMMAGLDAAKVKFDPVYAADALDPTRPVNAAVLDPANGLRMNYANLPAEFKRIVTLTDALTKQNFGAVNMTFGGFDYHLNSPAVQRQERHAFVARMILVWAANHILRQTNGVMMINTDGGIGFNDQAQNTVANGDAGSKNITLMIHVQGAGAAAAKPVFKLGGRFGALAVSEAAQRDNVFASRREMPSVAILYTFALLSGLVVNGQPSETEFLAAINGGLNLLPGGVAQLRSLSLLRT